MLELFLGNINNDSLISQNHNNGGGGLLYSSTSIECGISFAISLPIP